ncbi:polysaccharide biosynthesis protein [Hymenobacter radiodurans]|uniref:hypothetical protein n=1 Tax=Hymenobacter radiodurans TaxID=2496028 RepID=UPI001058B667|nr:hypothetical protein [Hymenobacter radiodurans]
MAPLVGVGGLAAFSTMRTGSNIALQGLNTITNPLIPDLMRFLQQRDQARCESVFGAVWIIVVALMAPAVVVLQAVIEPLYVVWTRGHIAFNPWLFALLSLSVLVFAVVQPATTIVVGNNLLKPQLLLSTLAALSVVGGIYLFVPRIGIVGAGVALLGAEMITSAGYKTVAQRWMHQHGMKWPNSSFLVAVTSISIAAVAMVLMIVFPLAKWPIVAISLLLFSVNTWRYWQVLPAIAVQHILRLASKFLWRRATLPV